MLGLKIYSLRCNVISVKTFFLLQLRALPSFLVRHFHVRHFQSTRLFQEAAGAAYTKSVAIAKKADRTA